MSQINFRMDDALKEKGEKLFNELGMSFTTALNVFVSQSVREGRLPFEVTTRTADPFYSESNMAILREAVREANEGKLTPHELIMD